MATVSLRQPAVCAGGRLQGVGVGGREHDLISIVTTVSLYGNVVQAWPRPDVSQSQDVGNREDAIDIRLTEQRGRKLRVVTCHPMCAPPPPPPFPSMRCNHPASIERADGGPTKSLPFLFHRVSLAPTLPPPLRWTRPRHAKVPTIAACK